MNSQTHGARNRGFSLIELMIAVVIFTIVAGVGLSLVAKSGPLYSRQQNMTTLNIALRSAVSQMEQDLVNAGTGYYIGETFPDWPVGVTIINNTSGSSCYDDSTHTYGAACFDKLNVITTDLSTPPAVLSTDTDSSISSTMSLKVPISNNPATGSPWTAADFAGKFHTGDQVLILKSDGSSLTTALLTDDATDGGTAPATIVLTHALTNTTGTNGTGAGDSGTACTQTDPTTDVDEDPLDITRCWNEKLGAAFDADVDYVLKLAAVTYRVDASDSQDPKLVRQVQPGGAEEIVADQVIGFKVGASLWNNVNGCANYHFDAANYPGVDDPCDDDTPADPDPYNFTRIRSVRVSLIGRTTPSTDPTYTFRNTFDGGAYQIQAVSVVVNPRNLSMRDQ